ncbi:glycosyltransferase (plasmid) [Thioclava sp. 'Guangxiensis']|uniref:glycosyltransferase n=1 Tax=Thioclava sp. 'Guangxiensis' TaxID=3149044 RepID=UPI0032C4147A
MTSESVLPELSIIVPVFNVDRYLPDCLDSLAALNDVAVEFILVDDGSTDGSRERCEARVRDDPRFRLLQAARVGPGEARNIGIRGARGAHIGFLDGDDLVVPEAYLAALRQVQASGSDFVTCAFRRLRGGGVLRKSRLSRGHAVSRSGVRPEDRPDLVFASVFWNKIFRRDFFEKACYPIPDGIFEDILPNLRAFCMSEQIDVCAQVAVLWRVREDKSSFTQKQGSRRNTAARLAVLAKCLAFLDSQPQGYRTAFQHKVIAHDAQILLKALAAVEETGLRLVARKVFVDLLALGPADETETLVGIQAFINATLPEPPSEEPLEDMIPLEEYSLVFRPRKATAISARTAIKIVSRGTTERFIGDFSSLHIHHLDAGRREVFWCDVPEDAPLMEEPFYYQGLRKLGSAGYAMSFDNIGPWQRPLRARPVVMASIGRCGSTLLSKLTKGMGLATWSEPDSFTNLAVTPELRAEPALYQGLMRLGLNVLADQAAQTGQSQFVVKLRAQATPVCEDLAAHHRDTLVFFVVREPVAWALSYHRLWGAAPEVLAKTLSDQLGYIRAAQARGLEVTVIDYDRLVAAPHETVGAICATLGVPALTPERIGAIFGVDAQKDTPVSRSSGTAPADGFAEAFVEALRQRAPDLAEMGPACWLAQGA